MPLVEDLAAFFTDFAEAITIDGVSVNALWNVEPTVALGMVGGYGILVQVPASTVVARNSVVVHAEKTYKVAKLPFEDAGIYTLDLTAA